MVAAPNEEQIEAFGQKLQAFAATLTPEERAILESIVALAMGEAAEGSEDEVQGYDAVSVQRPPQTAAQHLGVPSLYSKVNQARHDTKKSLIGNLPR